MDPPSSGQLTPVATKVIVLLEVLFGGKLLATALLFGWTLRLGLDRTFFIDVWGVHLR
jgi:hypothetical protein